MHKSLAVIREEHRALAGVLHGLQYLARQIAERKRAADFRLLRAMVDYILAFPVRLHHPKEDQHLFSTLRARDPGVVPVLAELEAEHVRDREYARELQEALGRFERAADAFPAFAAALDRYAALQWAHMRKEEDVVLPAAERALRPDDWAAIDAAFASNRDPLAGIDVSEEFRELFARIMAAAPAPIGNAPS
ncbi:MAG: hemerythrin domain-containing protein [Burkholderiales bacterium]|nr:hemerythrin domain-containing protein [Burkholderiales bacterium]